MAHSITDTCKMKREILNFARNFFDEWWNVKTSEFRRGDENRPPTPRFSEHPVEWYAPIPAPSLRELSSESETEGVYPDERNRSKISEPIRVFVQIFGPKQPSDDTPSVTPFGRASSLREGAGIGAYHSSDRPETATLRAIFIAPTEGGFHSLRELGFGV
mgnify:CR=1 FL=1